MLENELFCEKCKVMYFSEKKYTGEIDVDGKPVHRYRMDFGLCNKCSDELTLAEIAVQEMLNNCEHFVNVPKNLIAKIEICNEFLNAAGQENSKCEFKVIEFTCSADRLNNLLPFCFKGIYIDIKFQNFYGNYSLDHEKFGDYMSLMNGLIELKRNIFERLKK